MKIFVFNARKLYPLFTAVKLTAILLILVFSASFSVNLFLDSELYVSAANDLGTDKIIIIDAGHGGEDSGTIGTNGVLEKTLNLEIAEKIAEMLSDKGYAVVLTRTEDKLLYGEGENIKGMRKISDLKNRVKIAEQYPDGIFVSIHMNSYRTEKYSGFQAYFNGNDPNSRKLALAIQNSVKNGLQKDNQRAVKDGGELYILKNAPTTTVLLECGFLSNSEECEKLCEKEYQKQLCFAILCGIIKYIESKT